MLRIVTEDGYCPACEQKIWFDHDTEQNTCACGAAWVKGMYIRDVDDVDINQFLTVEVSSLD